MKESNVVYYSLVTTQRENFLDRMTEDVRKTLLTFPGSSTASPRLQAQ